MAKQQMLVSDISGETIAAGEDAKVVVTHNGKRWELDANVAEVSDLVAKGRETKKRGRPPKKS